VGGWVDGWMAGKAGLSIAYSNQKSKINIAYSKYFILFQQIKYGGRAELVVSLPAALKVKDSNPSVTYIFFHLNLILAVIQMVNYCHRQIIHIFCFGSIL
jgi:hypothetical protein